MCELKDLGKNLFGVGCLCEISYRLLAFNIYLCDFQKKSRLYIGKCKGTCRNPYIKKHKRSKALSHLHHKVAETDFSHF